jgi:hypothetical protein
MTTTTTDAFIQRMHDHALRIAASDRAQAAFDDVCHEEDLTPKQKSALRQVLHVVYGIRVR